MGHQKPLHLVLGLVIVGLTVVVGIHACAKNNEKAKQDAIIGDGIRIVNTAQA